LRRLTLILRRLTLILLGLVLRKRSERCLQHQQQPRQYYTHCQGFVRFHCFMFLASASNDTAYILY
jgi:hypothetical protein